MSDTTDDEKRKLLSLPSVASCIDAAVAYSEALWAHKSAYKKAHRVLRRKGMTDMDAHQLLGTESAKANLARLEAAMHADQKPEGPKEAAE